MESQLDYMPRAAERREAGRRANRIARCGALVLAALIAVVACSWGVNEWVLRRDLWSLETTMTRDQVLARLGTPDYDGSWSGSYGAGDYLVYEYPNLWNRF